MKEKSRRIKSAIITNSILVVILLAVFIVGFLPQQITPIYKSEKLSAIYNGDRDKRQVSMMFNVYENTEIVCKIVDELDKVGVKATFFLGGCWADDKHEIGNHGYFHKDHKKLSFAKNKEEIELTGIIIKALCGAEPKLFAPPSGSYSDVTLEVCEQLGYKAIMWSKDTIDWRDSDENVLIRRATDNLSNGDMVLMHPKAHTLSALPKILQIYAEQGFDVVTVGENIKDL